MLFRFYHLFDSPFRSLRISLLILLSLLPHLLIAQEPMMQEQTVRLRLYGGAARPLADTGKNGREEKRSEGTTITLINNREITFEESARRYEILRVDLPDRILYAEESPFDFLITRNGEEMRLRLEGGIDTLQFRPGIFSIPSLFLPFLSLRPLLPGGTILEQTIDRFRVASLDDEPDMPMINVASATPFRMKNPEGTIGGTLRVPFERHGPYSQVGGNIYALGRTTLIKEGKKNEIAGFYPYAMFSSADSGKTFEICASHTRSLLFDSATQGSIFFRSTTTGWITALYLVMMANGRLDLFSDDIRSYRTDDGGAGWRLDSVLTARRICDGSFAPTSDSSTPQYGWFSGLEPGDTNEAVIYMSDDGGEHLVRGRTAEPIAGDPRFQRFDSEHFPEIVSLNRDHALLLRRGYTLSFLQRVNGSDSISVTTVPAGVIDVNVLDDRHAWLIVGFRHFYDRYDTLEEGSDILYRTEDGGETWQPVLSGVGPFDRVSFYNHARGMVMNGVGITTTSDSGRTWQFTPFAALWKGKKFNPYIRTGSSLLTTLWLDERHLRLVASSGYLDVEVP